MSRRSPRPRIGIKYRRINGVSYYQDGEPHKTQKIAEAHARKLRRKGYPVRVFPCATGYQVYVGPRA